LAQVVDAKLDAIDNDLEQLTICQRRDSRLVERHRPSLNQQPAKAFSLQDINGSRDGGRLGTS
jgi:hypothetical protein